MTGNGVQEIVTGIWCWERLPRGLRPGEFGARTSYALVVEGETLFVDPEVATRLGDASGFEAVTGGTYVGGVARFHPLGSPPRSEQPIEIPARRALVFGDAVVETGGGELRVWDDPVDSERRRRWWHERYLPTLERLAALEAEHVLVTHGQPVLGNGAAALRRALERDPWQRPKR